MNDLFHLVAAPGAATICAWLGVKFQYPDLKVAPNYKLMFLILLSASGLGVFLGLFGGQGFFLYFVSFLGAAAFMDRHAFFAPDTLTFPMILLSCGVGSLVFGVGDGWISSWGFVSIGVTMYLLVCCFDEVAWRYGINVPPPVDVIGLILPFLIFGMSPLACATLVLSLTLILMNMKIDWINAFLVNPTCAEAALQSTGVPITKQSLRNLSPILLFTNVPIIAMSYAIYGFDLWGAL